MTGGRGWHGQVSNEEVSYHECCLQDVQGQFAELTQRLAAQNMEMYRNIDNRYSVSIFENRYHNHVLVREHLVWSG
jgi:hypothetical protein